MIGMDRITGKSIGAGERRRQAIEDILRTRIGSRVCNREYGSLLPDLIDQAMNAAGRLRVFAATAIAIARWEPEVRLTRVQLERGGEAGAFVLLLDGTDTVSGRPLALTIALPTVSA